MDEFGRIAGLVTIEDVLEQIVGEIEDEFDQDADAGDIFSLVDRTFRVSGDTDLLRVAEAFSLTFQMDEDTAIGESKFDTIGGFIAHAMGHVPRRGEFFDVSEQRFEVMHTKAGAVKWFKVYPSPAKAQTPEV